MAKKKRLFGQKRSTNPSSITSDFVGREEHLDSFKKALANESDHLLFNVYGQGGVGKTTLLNRFLELSKAAHHKTAFVDAEDKELFDRLAFMDYIAQELGKQHKKSPFKAFQQRYKDYLQAKGKLDADPERPKGGFGRLVTTGLKAGAKFGKEFIPMGSYIPTDAAAEIMGDWANFAAKKLSDTDELALVLNPIKVLTPLWVEGLNAIDEEITILIDTYEAANPALDQWFHQLLTHHYGAIDAFFLVIGGRDPLNQEPWKALRTWSCPISLAAFTIEEATAYLHKKGITNPTTITSILALSKCLPVYLALLAETGDNQSNDPNEQVVERFLKHLSNPIERNLALQAALPNQLNQDIIQCLLPTAEKDQAQAYFQWLKKRPFVQKRAGVWTYHPIVKELMRIYQKERSPKEWEQLHQHLAAYYQQRVEKEQVEGAREDWVQDANWRMYQFEYHFHSLCCHYKKYLPAAVRDFASVLSLTESETPLSLVELIIEVEQQLGIEKALGVVLKNGVVGLLAKRTEEHRRAILEMAKAINCKNWLQGKLEQSTFYFIQGLFEEEVNLSIEAYQQAIAVKPDYHEALYNLGNAYYKKGEFDNAINAYSKAINIKPDKHEALNNLGVAYENKGEFDNAISSYSKAINSKPDDYEAPYNLGVAYYKKEEIDNAISAYNKALNSKPDYHDALYNLGIAYYKKGEFDNAIDTYQKAVNIKPDFHKTFYNLGNAYYKKGEIDNAISAYTKALNSKPDYHEYHHSLAWTYLLQNQLSKAKQHFQQTWQLSNKTHNYAPMNLGHCALLQNHPQQALEWYQKSIPLWEDLNKCWQYMNQDYHDLNMKEQGITLEDYQALIAQLQASL